MQIDKSNEIEIITRAQKGEQEALTTIVNKYSDRLYTLLVRLLRDREEAEDALQETFITMIEKISTFRSKSQFYTWLYRIATNTALMKIRSRKNIKRMTIDEQVMSEEIHSGNITPFPVQPDKEFSKKELQEALDSAVKKLSAPYNSVFILRDIEQLSVRETAKILNISEDTVKTRLRRARIFLRNQLAETLS